MSGKNLMEKITPASGWRELTVGAAVYGEGNSVFFNTGEWRSEDPAWYADKCRHCLLCFPVCPDSSIPVVGGKRRDFDFGHCKGCGICAKVCPFGAISMSAAEKEAAK
ncbi:MAG: 4Fe-4S binding protein [Clostridiales Family XIII bacterium]|jgi:pyruvate ferredoxin oxidoreductase delta subunit|nr:4Fe-4S binding protein [Clostridiales Family XIII bacterium]